MSALLAPDGPALKLLPAAATLALHGLLLLALAARWEWQPERTIEARTITPKIIEAKLVTLDQLRPEPKPKPKPRAKPEPRQQAAPKPKPKPAAQQAKPAPKTAPKTTPKAEPRAEPKPAPKAEPEPREEQRMSAGELAALTRKELEAAVASEEEARVAVTATAAACRA